MAQTAHSFCSLESDGHQKNPGHETEPVLVASSLKASKPNIHRLFECLPFLYLILFSANQDFSDALPTRLSFFLRII